MTGMEGKKAVELKGMLKLANDTMATIIFFLEAEKRLPD